MASTIPPSPTKLEPSELDVEASKKEQDLSSPPSEELEPESNQAPEPATTAPTASQEEQWVAGIKLVNIMAAITLVVLLVLLDTSIVATVTVQNVPIVQTGD